MASTSGTSTSPIATRTADWARAIARLVETIDRCGALSPRAVEGDRIDDAQIPDGPEHRGPEDDGRELSPPRRPQRSREDDPRHHVQHLDERGGNEARGGRAARLSPESRASPGAGAVVGELTRPCGP